MPDATEPDTGDVEASPDAEDGEPPDVVSEADAGDGPADEAESPPPDSIDVLVTTSAWYDVLSAAPTRGVTVALDAPGGMRIERTTGADGRVTFTDLDWTLGTASVTAYLAGFVVVSRVGLTGEDARAGEWVIDLAQSGERTYGFVSVSGWAEGFQDEDHSMVVSATVPNTMSWYRGSGWRLDLLRGLPYTLVAVEVDVDAWGYGPCSAYVQWTMTEQPAARGATVAPLDFRIPVEPTTVTTTVTSPPRTADGTEAEFGFCHIDVTSLDSAGTARLNGIGTSYSSYPTSSQPFWTLDPCFVMPADVARPITIASLSDGQLITSPPQPEGRTVATLIEGYPPAGPFPVAFLDPSQVLVPDDPMREHPLSDAIAWRSFTSDARTRVEIWRTDDGLTRTELLWTVESPEDAESVVVPELPLAVDPPSFFGDSPAVAQVVVYRDGPDPRYPSQESRSRAFRLLTR